MFALLASVSALALATPAAGVGLLVGEPISVTARVTLTERLAIHADVGPSTSERVRMIAAADLIYALPEVFGKLGDGFLFPWFGVGPRFAVLKQLAHGPIQLTDTRAHFGFRTPFGISLVLEDSLELFAEIAPGLALVPSSLGSIDGGLGIRLGF